MTKKEAKEYEKELRRTWCDDTLIGFLGTFVKIQIFETISDTDAFIYAKAFKEIMVEKGVDTKSFDSVFDWLYKGGVQKEFKACDELYDLLDKKVVEILFRNISFEFSLGE